MVCGVLVLVCSYALGVYGHIEALKEAIDIEAKYSYTLIRIRFFV